MKRFLVLAALAAAPLSPASAQSVDTRALSRVSAADSNHDKMVTRQEFVTYRAGQFQRLDRNHDGVLSPADVPRLAGRSPMGMDMESMMTQFDANRDGVVNRAEFVNGPTPAFDLCDADHNQVVTLAEIDAARARQR